MAKWGRIDTLVNNAGSRPGRSPKKMTDDRRGSGDVNSKASTTAPASVDIMLEQNSCPQCLLDRRGIYFGNFGQTTGRPFGVIGMVKTWARVFRTQGIRANAICPGFIHADSRDDAGEDIKMMEDRVPMGRQQSPEEIATRLARTRELYINGAS
mgnify:CR=1 FL=1